MTDNTPDVSEERALKLAAREKKQAQIAELVEQEHSLERERVLAEADRVDAIARGRKVMPELDAVRSKIAALKGQPAA